MVRMVLAPQFWMSVRGITSSAFATDSYGHWCTPWIDLARSRSA